MEMDLVAASRILKRAFTEKDDYELTANDQSQIQFYTTGMGVTYAYIFVTGLLAKATDARLNPICLQAGSGLPGAYDARSLCHKVIVPDTDVNLLLGSSNEPFLNKPARISSLDKQTAFKSDALRDGVRDMISFFKTLDSSLQAFEALKYSLHYLSEVKANESVSIDDLLDRLRKEVSDRSKQLTLLEFYKNVLNVSCEGESLILCVHTALANHYQNNPHVKIISHPSNESGASSREVEDIDLLYDDVPFCCVELKDKLYDVPDISNSMKKVVAAKVLSLLFVEGPNARFIGNPEKLSRFIESAAKIGVNVQILAATSLLACLITLSPDVKPPLVVEDGLHISKEIRVKKKTLDNWTLAANSLVKKSN